jgi:dimethylargininase
VTYVGVLLLNTEFVDAGFFDDVETVSVHSSEPDAGNELRIGETVLMPSSWPLTRALLEERGLRVVAVDADELEKAESGVTCCSLVFDAQ